MERVTAEIVIPNLFSIWVAFEDRRFSVVYPLFCGGLIGI